MLTLRGVTRVRSCRRTSRFLGCSIGRQPGRSRLIRGMSEFVCAAAVREQVLTPRAAEERCPRAADR
jgi:hypothetical protein